MKSLDLEQVARHEVDRLGADPASPHTPFAHEDADVCAPICAIDRAVFDVSDVTFVRRVDPENHLVRTKRGQIGARLVRRDRRLPLPARIAIHLGVGEPSQVSIADIGLTEAAQRHAPAPNFRREFAVGLPNGAEPGGSRDSLGIGPVERIIDIDRAIIRDLGDAHRVGKDQSGTPQRFCPHNVASPIGKPRRCQLLAVLLVAGDTLAQHGSYAAFAVFGEDPLRRIGGAARREAKVPAGIRHAFETRVDVLGQNEGRRRLKQSRERVALSVEPLHRIERMKHDVGGAGIVLRQRRRPAKRRRDAVGFAGRRDLFVFGRDDDPRQARCGRGAAHPGNQRRPQQRLDVFARQPLRASAREDDAQ